MAEFALAGALSSVKAIGTWWATIPKENWPDTESTREYLREHWQEPWGDRRQELVFIGSGIDWPSLNAALDNCLVNDDAVNSIETLPDLPDPFPVWEFTPVQE